MKQYKVVVTGVLALMSITSVFASFESDYQKFINQLIASSPVAGHNAFSGVVALDVTMAEGGKAHADIRINGLVHTGIQRVMGDLGMSIDVSNDIFPLTESGDAKLDAVMGVIAMGTGSSSGSYITLKQFDTNIAMLLQTGTQEKIDILKSGWFSLPDEIEQDTPVASVSSSIAKRAQIYQAFIKYPVVTPAKPKSMASGGKYDVRLNKSNIVRLTTRIAQINDPQLQGTGLNQVRTDMIDTLRTITSKGIFDTNNQSLALAVMNTSTKSNVMIGLSTGSLLIKSSDKSANGDNMNVKITSTWDQNNIGGSIVASNSEMSATFMVKMNTYWDTTTQIVAPATYRSLDGVLD